MLDAGTLTAVTLLTAKKKKLITKYRALSHASARLGHVQHQPVECMAIVDSLGDQQKLVGTHPRRQRRQSADGPHTSHMSVRRHTELQILVQFT